MILNIPHASKKIPADIRKQLVLSDTELAEELLRMTDSYTDELFDFSIAQRRVFPVSRLVIDPERFVDDEKELMSSVGMGVVYLKTSQGQQLRRSISSVVKQSLIARYYSPYHEGLRTAVQSEKEHIGGCLIIDCHSFSSRPLAYEFDQLSNRPDICLGTDPYHTPLWLEECAIAQLKELGLTIGVNRPFQGTLVPLSYYHTDESVYSIMLEINRRLYMNEETGEKNIFFTDIQKKLRIALKTINETYREQVGISSHSFQK